MGSKSQYLEKAVLDGIYGGPAFSLPATVYIALYTTGTLNSASTGTTPGAVEVSASGTAYTRLAVTNNATNFPGATTGVPTRKLNGTALTFPTATADWGTVTQWAILDAPTNGNILHWGAFSSSRLVQNGDTPTIAAGAIQISET